MQQVVDSTATGNVRPDQGTSITCEPNEEQPPTSATALPEINAQLEAMARQLAEANKRAAHAEEKAVRLEQKNARHAATSVPKAIPRPWEDLKLTGKYDEHPLNAALVIKVTRFGMTECGPADFGPPPHGMNGFDQKGMPGLPRHRIEAWILDALDSSDDRDAGIQRAARRLEQKCDALMLTAREYGVRAGHYIAWRVSLDRHGDHAEAQRDFLGAKPIDVCDPAAVVTEAPAK